jgi:uncharacterized membrane protein YccC
VTDSLLRIFHTVVGSLLALVSGYLLFPLWESQRFPVHVAAAFRADAAFLRAFRDLMRGKVERPMSEFRRDAAVATSNAVTAAQRLLTEPSHRRGNVEASLAAANYGRQILHALAAISDYPAREPMGVQSGDLLGLVEALATALDVLATSLEAGSNPPRLRDLVAVTDRLEESMGTVPQGHEDASGMVKNPHGSEMAPWLFYHLKNASELTLAAREVVSRLLRSETRSGETKGGMLAAFR